jgi:hypothetical protein
MSTIPAKKIERDHNKPKGRHQVSASPANHSYDGEEVRCFALGGGT